MPTLRRILLFFGSFMILFLIVFYTEPPASWVDASAWQILSVFLPLLLTFSAFINIFLRYSPHSFILGLGFVVIISLLAGGNLNFLNGFLVILISILILRFFPKTRFPTIKLTRSDKIPKLSRLRRNQK